MGHYILICALFGLFRLGADLSAKADGLVAAPLLNDVGKPIKGAAADKEDVLCVDVKKFLIGMLSSALRRNVCHRTL